MVIMGLWTRWKGRPGYLPPQSVRAATDPSLQKSQLALSPQQHNLWIPRTWESGGFRYRAQAEFALTARVLITTSFSEGAEAQVSPVDLTLGWGPMATDAWLTKISLSHSGRYYQWETGDPDLDRRVIETHSANMHIIPRNAKVDRVLRQIGVGEIISLTGYLVNLDSVEDGWYWRSSTTRNDTGSGACELVYADWIYRQSSP